MAHCSTAVAAGTLVLAFFQTNPANADQSAAPAFPAKSLRMIVPLAPGGGSDIVGRILAQGLTEYWSKPVVVDNRPGAGSAVGTSIAAKAAADGYTLLVSSSSLAITPALYKNLDFDVRRDFAPVMLIASQPSMLVVHPSVRANSVDDLVTLAKRNKLAYSSAGIGSATHLGTELLLHKAHAQMLHVPYKSAGLATGAVLSGEVHVLLTNMASVLPHISSGKLRALGISSTKRAAAATHVPTIAESGLPGFEYLTWYGMLAPRGTPPAIVAFTNKAAAHVLQKPDVSQRLIAQGLQIHASAPTEFGKYLQAEIDRWAQVVRSAEISVE